MKNLPALALVTSFTLLSVHAMADDYSRLAWSAESNGLQARLALRRWKVTNGSGVIATYLEFQNVADVVNPKTISVKDDNIKFRVTDKDGNEIAPATNVAFSGRMFGTPRLVLPMDSFLRLRIGPTGHGIGRDLGAHLDLGLRHCWALPPKEYHLSAVLEIEETSGNRDFETPWHGRLELPSVPIPITSPAIAPQELGTIIEELGATMLEGNGRESGRAFDEMSLIEDPRVVEWYVKAVQMKFYGHRMRALGRLRHFNNDQALDGIKIGIETTGDELGNVSTKKGADSLANNIRHAAAIALARSPHPKAKAILWTHHNDKATAVRITVIQAAARQATAETIEVVRQHIDDSDQRVKDEAIRLLKEYENR